MTIVVQGGPRGAGWAGTAGRAVLAALVGAALVGGVVAACAADPPAGPTATAPPRANVQPAPEPGAEPTAEVTAEAGAPAGAAPGPTVQEITTALDAVAPTRHARDNTGSCTGAGCVGLVTTGAVSVYQWSSVSAATRYVDKGAGTADRIGVYVLSYRSTEQRSTSPQVRRAYADKVRALVGPGA